jgi:hypothetical protein
MPMKIMLVLLIIGLLESWLPAVEPCDTNYIAMVLQKVPAAELPLAAARIVKGAKPQDRTALVPNVIKIAVRINPAATTAIVGAVAQAVPEVAAAAARAAVTEQPSLAVPIAQTAVAIVPDRASQIVEFLCAVVPAEYSDIAIAASRLAPVRSKAILKVVEEIRPELKPYLEFELAKYQRTQPPVPDCLAQAELAQRQAVAAQRGGWGASPAAPRGGPPITPPGQLGSNPPKGGASPPGGRNYARP